MRNKELIRNLMYALTKATENDSYTEEERTIIRFLGYSIRDITEANYKEAIHNIELLNNDFLILCNKRINDNMFKEIYKENK